MPAVLGNASDQYLTQAIASSNAEQLMALLLGGAHRFTEQAAAAIRRRDIAGKARLVNRISAIVEEMMVRLNHEEGGELVQNLGRIYEWWLHELFEGSQRNQAERLERISAQMSSMQQTWEELGRRRVPPSQAVLLQAEGLVG